MSFVNKTKVMKCQTLVNLSWVQFSLETNRPENKFPVPPSFNYHVCSDPFINLTHSPVRHKFLRLASTIGKYTINSLN